MEQDSMFPFNKIFGLSLTCLLAVVISLQSQATGRGKQQNAPKVPPCRVLIVVHAEYPANRLVHAADSAMELSKELGTIGYQVQLLTEEKSAKLFREKLTAKEKNITVAEAEDSKTVKEKIESWMMESAKIKSPLSFLVMSGHGTVRKVGGNDSSFLLCVGDKGKNDGVSVEKLREVSGKLRLPLVMVFDACRTTDGVIEKGAKAPEAKKENPIPNSSLDTKSPVPEVTVLRAPPGTVMPTILYSTRKGQFADDKESLCKHLAGGLQTKDKLLRKFLEAVKEKGERDELTLLCWFNYAISKVQQAQKLQQPHEIHTGIVPLNTAFLTWENNKVATPKALFTRIDLLPQLDFWAGGFISEKEGPFWKITNPGIPKEFRSAKIKGPNGQEDEGFDLDQGGVIVMDLVAGFDTKFPAKELKFSINAAHYTKEKPGEYLPLTFSDVPHTLEPNRITTVRIPVRAKGAFKSLNGLQFGDRGWPAQAHLRMLAMRLETMAGNDMGTTTKQKNPDVLAEWIYLNQVSTVDRLDANPTDKGLALRPSKDKGKLKYSECGGDLLSPIFIPKGYGIEIEAYTSDGKKAQLQFQFVWKDDKGATTTVFEKTLEIGSLPKGSQKFRSEGDLTANYLIVGTQADTIVLRKVRLVPIGPPIVQKRK
jgi:hypothetical protein